MKISIQYPFLSLFIIASVCMFANDPNSLQQPHINKYPEVGKILNWGMKIDQIEKAINASLRNTAKNRYQATFILGCKEYDTIFIVTEEKLEGIVLKYHIKNTEFSDLINLLTKSLGAPSAFDLSKLAYQWKDSKNDTGIFVSEKINDIYTVNVGMRFLSNQTILEKLEPCKISSLQGVILGMSKDSFLKSNHYFEPIALAPESDTPASMTVYRATLGFDMLVSEAFFEFNNNILSYVMIYIPTNSSNKDEISKSFDQHLGHLTKFYDTPNSKGNLFTSWKAGKLEMKYGLHPNGKFVVSWALLSAH